MSDATVAKEDLKELVGRWEAKENSKTSREPGERAAFKICREDVLAVLEDDAKDDAYEWFLRGFMTAGEGWNGGYPYDGAIDEARQSEPLQQEFEQAWEDYEVQE